MILRIFKCSYFLSLKVTTGIILFQNTAPKCVLPFKTPKLKVLGEYTKLNPSYTFTHGVGQNILLGLSVRCYGQTQTFLANPIHRGLTYLWEDATLEVERANGPIVTRHHYGQLMNM